MSKTASANPVEDAAVAERDPRMIPGHPLCDYKRYFASLPQKTIVLNGDPLNPQYTETFLSINGYEWGPIEFGKPTKVPAPYADMVHPSRGVVID